MKRIGASILLLGSIVLFSSVARALETLEEKQLRWILYDDWPEDKISVDTPVDLGELHGLSPKLAAQIIREVLLDEEREAEPYLCADAIWKYRVFSEAKYLRRYVPIYKKRLKEDKSFHEGAVAELLRSIALLGGHDPQLARYCKVQAWDLLRQFYPLDGSVEGFEPRVMRPLLATLWLVGGEEDLRKLQAVAKRSIAAFDQKYPYTVLSEVRDEDGTVSRVLKPPEPPPSDIERERKKWDKMIALDNNYFEYLAKRRKANTMEGQARLVQIAQFIIEGQPEKWATGVLLREADKPTRSRAVRDALASLLKRPEEELPYSHDDSRSIAYEWLEKFGDGMTKREQKLYEKYEGEPYEK